MRKPRRISAVFGSIALIMSLLSFALGSAPFMPALGMTVISVPLAVISGLYGAWRLGITAIYYSCTAWLVVPMARELPIRIDYLLAVLGIIGLGIAGSLYYGYLRSVRVT